MPDLTTSVAEPSAAKDSYLGDAFTKFAERVSPDLKESTETKPVKDAEPGAADTSEKTKPEAQAKTAPEPGAGPKQENKDKDKPNAEERIDRLNAEIKKLQAETERLKTQPKAEVKAEAIKEPPKRPDPYSWDGTKEDYGKALDAYEQWRDEQVIAKFQERTQQEATVKQVQEKLETARKKYPDADTKVFPALEAISQAPIANAVKAMIDDSDVMVDLLYTLGDAAKLKEFLATAQTNPGKALREVFVLENLIREELKGKAKPEAEKKAPAEPKAPEPPKEVGGKGTTPTDELDASVRDDDYRRSKAEINRRYFAAS